MRRFKIYGGIMIGTLLVIGGIVAVASAIKGNSSKGSSPAPKYPTRDTLTPEQRLIYDQLKLEEKRKRDEQRARDAFDYDDPKRRQIRIEEDWKKKKREWADRQRKKRGY